MFQKHPKKQKRHIHEWIWLNWWIPHCLFPYEKGRGGIFFRMKAKARKPLTGWWWNISSLEEPAVSTMNPFYFSANAQLPRPRASDYPRRPAPASRFDPAANWSPSYYLSFQECDNSGWSPARPSAVCLHTYRNKTNWTPCGNRSSAQREDNIPFC